MKKLIVIKTSGSYRRLSMLLILCLVAGSTMACDICGCGVGGGYLGLLPGFRKRFIGLRYLQNGLISHRGPGGSTTYLTSKEQFRIMELWGAANIGKKFRVTAFVPFNFLERENGLGKTSRSGLGDITLIGYYQLLNKTKTVFTDKLMVQSLWVGTGIKLPTGKYDPEDKNVQDNSQNTFQLGTGSVDFSVHAMYDVRIQDFGVNVNASYKWNTTNEDEYQYGNKLTTNVLAYYKIKVGKQTTIAPNTGILFESAGKDTRARELKIWESGGRSLMGTIGLEVASGHWGFGTNYQSPLSQNLGERKVLARNRGMVYISYSF
jgi:hypothetical protein